MRHLSEPRLLSRLSARLLGAVLLAAVLLLAAPVAAKDPGAPGPFAVSTTSYDDGDTAFTPTGFPGPVEVRASVHHPSDLSAGPFPLVVFLHGRHATCYEGTSAFLQWPCTGSRLPIPSFEGYDYVAEIVASHGYVVVSISANGINARDNSVADLGMLARAELIQHHLEKWSVWNTTGGAPFGSLFVGRLDLDNVGTMGHSRGGEGVVRHFVLNLEVGAPFGIRAVLPIAPTDFNRDVINHVPLGVVLPYCDGDVNDLQGVHFYDDARYNVPGDSAFKHTFLVMGANHNYYNTVWTPGLFPAGARDDWFFTSDPYCGTVAGNGRLTPAEQRGTGIAYITAFFRRYLGGETDFAPLLTAGAKVPPSAQGATVHASFHAPDDPDLRLDVNRLLDASDLVVNELGGAVSQVGLAPYDLCGGEAPQPQHCLSGSTARQPHTTPSFNAPGMRGLSQLRMGWDAPTATWTHELPAGANDVSRFDVLQFRGGVNWQDPRNPPGATQDLSITLTDGLGRSATTGSVQLFKTLFYPPGTTFAVPKLFLNTVRLPLSEFKGIDLRDVREIELAFDRDDTGALMITDLAFSALEPRPPSCCEQRLVFREIPLEGSTTLQLGDDVHPYCATGGAKAPAGQGYCYADHDGAGTWRLYAENASCNFFCVVRRDGCPPSPFVREEYLFEGTGADLEELRLADMVVAYCATGGAKVGVPGGFCYGHHDAFDAEWELFASGAACNFACVPTASTCSDFQFQELFVSGSSQTVVDDTTYSFCALGGAVPSSPDGYCWLDHDPWTGQWTMSATKASCNFVCIL